VHGHAAPSERERDPPGPDAELEGASVAGELGEQVDDWADRRGAGQLVRGIVVPGGDALVEVAVVARYRVRP
jgi:hypothetical protein